MTPVQSRLIVLLSDGNRIKGFARDFNPARDNFHVAVAGPEGETGELRQVRMSHVDAVFFVRDFAFDREKRYEPEGDLASAISPPIAGARAIEVTTRWGGGGAGRFPAVREGRGRLMRSPRAAVVAVSQASRRGRERAIFVSGGPCAGR